MKKKYQVFVSSTYNDLKEERGRVFEAILAMEHIPVGMEYFGSRNRSSVEIIQNFLDQCDFQVTIIGTKYGSLISGSQISFTEMEYDYANEKRIPQLTFLQKSKDGYVSSKEAQKSIDRLKKFRAKAERLQCAFWQSASELERAVYQSLPKEIEDAKRPGWIRASDVGEFASLDLKSANNELAGVKSALDRYRRNVVESNRQRFEHNLLQTPSLTGLWQCQEKSTTLELIEYGGAIVSHFLTGTHEHWLHGVWTPEGKEAQVQIWRRERAPIAGTEKRQTVMFGRFHNVSDDLFHYEMFASDGKADLHHNYSEKLTWKRLTLLVA